jgi:hypothetical protein
MDEEGWERYELHGRNVYQLDICEAIHDHHLCPGVTLLKAGEHELGPYSAIVRATRNQT